MNFLETYEYYLEKVTPKDDVKYLYHATFEPYLKSIMSKGLGKTDIPNYDDSKKGVVYMAYDPDVAESYAEVVDNEDIPDDWFDKIVILKIDVSGLDKDKLSDDRNVLDDDSTVEYHGVIAPKYITRVNLEEGKVKSTALGAMAALSMLGTNAKARDIPKEPTKIVQKVDKNETITLRVAKKYIGKNEGERNDMYKDSEGNWTIGIGHLVKPNEIEKFKGGIDDTTMRELFNKDMQKHLKTAKNLFDDFSKYPPYLQVALLDSVFRGEMKSTHNTVKLINKGEWDKVPAEYIDRDDYTSSKKHGEKHGVWKRMDRNASRFKHYANSLKDKK